MNEATNLYGIAVRWLACLGVAFPCLASQLRPLTPETLGVRAETVVLARVQAIETVREGDAGLVTRIELDVSQVWKGTETNRLTLTQPGGTLGSRRVVVEADADYRLGEEVVVFAVRSRAGEWLTLELAQGKFHVQRPVEPPARAWVRGVFWGGDPAPGGARPAHRLPLSLEALEKRVREAGR